MKNLTNNVNVCVEELLQYLMSIPQPAASRGELDIPGDLRRVFVHDGRARRLGTHHYPTSGASGKHL